MRAGGNFLRALRWLDANLEKVILITAFAFCAGIIAVEVFRRFVLSQQAPWSTFIPAYLFLWLTWIGASYGAKMRCHLSFHELRDRMPRHWQFALIQLDNILYFVFAAIVIYWSWDLAYLHFRLDSVVPGTNNVPSWLFYSATPVGWSLLVLRVTQNAVEEISSYLRGEPLPRRGSLGATD